MNRILEFRSFRSSWGLELQRQLSLRPALLLLIGLAIGLTVWRFPWNGLFLLAVFALVLGAPARAFLAAGFALGAVFAPAGPVVPGSRLPGAEGPLRAPLTQSWAVVLPAHEADCLAAVSLGEADRLSRSDRQAIVRTGAYSLISSAGLQVFSLAWAATQLFGLLPMPRGLRLGLSFLVLVLYLVATGFQAGTFRAVGICGLTWLAPFLRREFDGLSALGLVGVAYLLFHPAGIYEQGFQFSVIAVAGWYVRPVAESFGWSSALWMWLVMFPLSAVMTGYASFSGLVVGPAVFLVTPVALIGAWLGSALGWLPWLGSGLLRGAGTLASGEIRCLVWLADQPWIGVPVASLSAYWLVLYYGFLLRLWSPMVRPIAPKRT